MASAINFSIDSCSGRERGGVKVVTLFTRVPQRVNDAMGRSVRMHTEAAVVVGQPVMLPARSTL
jgi:hypothetical protein